MKPRRALIGPGILAAAYMVGVSVFVLRAGNMEFVFYALVMLALIGAVWWLDTRVRLTSFTLWCLSIWGLAHMLGGTVPIPAGLAEPGEQEVLYSLRVHPWAPKYDQVVHAFGFFTTTLVAWRALNAAVDGVSPGRSLPPTFGPIFAAMMVSMGLSAMNEIIEFGATLLFTETNVGGYVNTGWDLVSNFTGCAIAGARIRINGRRNGPAQERAQGRERASGPG